MRLLSYLLVLVILTLNVNAVIISEVMYNPEGSDTNREWIELYNEDNETIDIENWKFRENDVNHNLNLYQGSFLISEHGFLIIARNGDSFLSDYPGYSGNIVTSSFSLSNTGEEIYIIDNNLNEIDFLNYNLTDEGYSVELFYPVKWVQGTYKGQPGSITKQESKEVPEFSILGVIAIVIIAAIIRFRT